MRPFTNIVVFLLLLFLFKPTIVSIIEKKIPSGYSKETIVEEDDTNEREKLAPFKQLITIETQKSPISTTSPIRLFDIFSIPTNYIQKINTPPPRNI